MKYKKTIITFAILLLLTPLFYYVCGSIDENPKEFPDLAAYSFPEEPDGVNGLNLILKAHQEDFSSSPIFTSLKEDIDDLPFDPNKSQNIEKWEEILNKYSQELSWIHQGMDCSNFTDLGLREADNKGERKEHIKLLGISRLIKLHTVTAILKKDWATVTKNINKTIKFIKLYREQNPHIICYIIAQDLASKLWETIHHLTIYKKTPPQILREISLQLLVHDDFLWKKSLSNCYRSEYKKLHFYYNNRDLYLNEQVGIGLSSLKLTTFNFHLNWFLNRQFELYQALISCESLSPREVKLTLTQLPDKFTQHDLLSRHDYLPNQQGKKLFAFSLAQPHALLRYNYKGDITKELLALKIAATLYRQKHGSLPDKLEPLYKILGKKLYDPLAPPNTPYQYSKQDKKIWSFGANLKNDQGSSESYIFDFSQSHPDFMLHLTNNAEPFPSNE